MDNDQREGRDWPEAEADSDAGGSAADEPVGAQREPASAEPPPGEPAQNEAAPSEPAPSEPALGEPQAAPTDWPSEDTAAPTQPEPAWPTEPPEAGSAPEGSWPTSAPEPGEQEMAAAEPTPMEAEAAAPMAAAAAAPDAPTEPPPEEIEAYPAPGTAAEAAAAAAIATPATDAATGESTQCPRCGTENPPGLTFCRNCGQRLVAAGVATTVERPGTPEGTTACPRCGTHNRAGVAFCQNCGANLRATAPGYVPPAVAGASTAAAAVEAQRGGAVLGPIVLLIGVIGLVTGYLLPFLPSGAGSLYERALGSDGYGFAFWQGYPDGASLQDQLYFGFAAPVPILAALLVVLAIAGFVRAAPGALQRIGLVIALVWSIGLIVLFVVVEILGSWNGDLVGLLRDLSPAGIIFFLSSLIVVIGSLTRFARS